MKTVNYNDLKLNLKKWLDFVTNDVGELVVKRKNNKDLVLIPLKEYNALKETCYLLSGKNGGRLLTSKEQAEKENVIKRDLLC
jgi:antitoxin YefM